MDEKKREDNDLIDGAAANSPEADASPVTADDLLGKLSLNIGKSKRKQRRERKKKSAPEETRDTTSDFFDLSINDPEPGTDPDSIIRGVMGDAEYQKYVAGADASAASDDYDEFVAEFSANIATDEKVSADGDALSGEAEGTGSVKEESSAATEADRTNTAASESEDIGTVGGVDIGTVANDIGEQTPESMLADIVGASEGATTGVPAFAGDENPVGSGEEVPDDVFLPSESDTIGDAAAESTAASDNGAEEGGDGTVGDSGDEFDAFDDDIDDTDVQLMVAFGMDDELAKTVGFEKAVELSENPEYVTGMMNKVGDEPEEPEEPAEIDEFTSPEQIKPILTGYKRRYRTMLIKLACAALLLIFSFFYDNLPVFGAALPNWMDSHTYPIVYTMFGLQMTLLAGALAWKHIRDGALSVADRRVTVDTLLVAVLVWTVIYDAVMCCLHMHGAPDGIRMFSCPGVLMALLALLGEYMDFRREVFSFNIVASKKDKYVIEKLSETQATLETNAFSGFLPENATIFRLGQTKFVDGFYARMRQSCSATRASGVLVIIAFAAAAVFFGLDLFLGRSFDRAFTVAQFTVSIGIPCAAMLVYSLPFFSASKLAYKTGSAIIGGRSLEEYCTGASAITFEDKDVFPARGVMVKSIKTYGDSPIDYVIYNVASLFMKVGGPLAQVFEAATHDLEHTDDVKLTSVVSGGLEAYVQGRHVYCGNADYFTDNGLPSPSDPEDEILRGQSAVSIMYLAIDGETVAKLYIQYTLDPDFMVTLKQLSKLGICVGVKTFDPNITDLMLDRSISLADYPIKILRCRTIDDLAVSSEHTESGVVSRRSVKSMMTAYSLCEKVLHSMRIGTMLKILATVFSFVIVALMILVKLSGSVSSWHAVLYQLAWIVPAVLITKIYVGKN